VRRLTAVLLCLGMVIGGLVALLTGAPASSAAGAASAPGGMFRPVEPARLLDTRKSGSLGASRTVRFAVGGHGGIPVGAEAVTVNITVLSPARSGSVSVFPGGTSWNGAGSVNFAARQTKQSMLTATLGSDGSLAARNNTGAPVQLIADVSGYYTGGTAAAPGAFRAIGFQRSFDTRGGHPLPAGGSETSVPVGGRGLIPASGVAGVVATLTVLSPSRAGSVAAYPRIWDRTTSMSFAAGRTEQDALTIGLDDHGRMVLRNNTAAPLQVVLDVFGYYLAGTPAENGSLQPTAPVRLLDERVKQSPGDYGLGPGNEVTVYPAADQALPRWGVPAVLLRITVLAPYRAGSLSVYPGDRSWNGSTSVSFAASATVQQQLVTRLGANGQLTLRNDTGSSYLTLVVDVLGYYLGQANPLQRGSRTAIDQTEGYPEQASCPSVTFCMVLERTGSALTWNGSQWSAPVRLPNADLMHSVSCVSATFCMAGGAGKDRDQIFAYDGSSWTVSTTFPQHTSETRVSCVSTTFCLASAETGYRVFDGSTWSAAPSLPSDLYQLSCASADFCLGIDGRLALHAFDGSGWTQQQVSNFKPTDVSCPSADFCAAIGNHDAATFDGTRWTVTSVDPDHPLTTVSCLSSSNCRAADEAGAVTSYDGRGWSQPVAADPNGGQSISCAAPDFCLLIDGSYRAVTFDGTDWSSPQRIDWPAGFLRDVSCASTSFCMAVDAGGYAVRFDGAEWDGPVRVTTGVPLTKVSCPAAERCVAVDATGRAASYDGSGWSDPAPVDPGHQLTGISCATPSFCVAIADDGTASSFDGATWSTPVVASGRPLVAVSCPTSTFCLAVDNNTGSVSYDGIRWSSAASRPDLHGDRLSCPTADFCVLSGSSPAIGRWQHGSWSGIPTALSKPVAASCATAQFCPAIDGSQGWLTALAGTDWTMPVAMSGGLYEPAISCPTSSFCMAVDDYSYAVRFDG